MNKRSTRHEKLVKALVEGVNRLPGVKVWRNDTGMMPVARIGEVFKGKYRPYGTRFVSDILGFMSPAGRFIAIEAKTGKGKTSEGQEGFLWHVGEDGGLAIVCTWDYHKHPCGMNSAVRNAVQAVRDAVESANR